MMNVLIQSPPDTIEIDGIIYRINTHYARTLYVWAAHAALDAGEIKPLDYAVALIENMYHAPKPDVFSKQAMQFASDYINFFSREPDGERKTNVPPIDIEQDGAMIYSAMLSMGIHLKRDNVSIEDFMAYWHELPPDCTFCRIMYYRVMYYDKRSKMTKDDKEACKRIGWDVIKVRNRKAEREKSDNEDYFRKLQAQLRVERGLV